MAAWATGSAISAQVMVEALSNNLKVNGTHATSAIDGSIVATHPGISRDELTANVRVYQKAIKQAKISVSAAHALTQSNELVHIMDALEGIPAGSLPEDVARILPPEMGDILAQPILLAYAANDAQLEAVNGITEPVLNPDADSGNTAPVIDGVPAASVSAGGSYSFQPSASDADGDNLVFRMKRGTGFLNKMDGISYKNVFATYTHIHALGVPSWAGTMVDNAIAITVEHFGKAV